MNVNPATASSTNDPVTATPASAPVSAGSTTAASAPRPTDGASSAAENSAKPSRPVDWNNPRVAAILEAAAACFARKGFSSTTLAEIGKELGLRKSIVHYYFDSKAALIHEVQRYTYKKYLDRVQGALASTRDAPAGQRAASALRALWEARSTSNIGLNIEVWSASRTDEELRRQASELFREKRRLIVDGIREALGADGSKQVADAEGLATLILAVLDGLSVSGYVEGDEGRTDDAYRLFLYLLRLGIDKLGTGPVPSA